MRSSWTSVALLATACTHAPANVTLGPVSSSHAAVTLSSMRAPPVADDVCPRLPLEVVAQTRDSSERVVLSLDRAGDVIASWVGPPSVIAHLDPRGCLSSRDGVEIDIADGHRFWTRNQRFTLTSDALELTNGAMRIEPTGEIVRTTNGEVATPTHLAFRHYTPRAACAARILLVMLVLSAPSSDATLPVLAPPQSSACADLHVRDL